MALFILIAAILVAAALGMVLRPLLRTQRKLALALLVGMPLLTFALYRLVGAPQALDPEFIARNQPAPDINTALASLQDELKANPGNIEGWVLLARTQMAMGKIEESKNAFRQAIKLQPDNPDLKAELAEAMLRTAKERAFPAEAIQLLQQALAENPEHERALFFMGMNFLQKGDLSQAETYLDKLLPMLDVEAANALREQINIARAEKKLPLLPMASMANAVKPIKIKVTLDKSLAASVKPGSVLFVFAKSLDGKGPPLAAKRIEVDTFPIELELSDADSLMPTAKLSSQKKVSLSARISIQGIANAQVGDIEADSLVVDASSEKPVEITLSRVKK